MDERVFTITVGGRAGEGVKKAAQVIAHIFCAAGWNVCQADDYQSLIRGGHNFSTVSTSQTPVYCAHQNHDLLICFDQRSIDKHLKRLKDGALLFYNSDEAQCEQGIPIPMNSLMKKHYHGASNVSLAALAIFAALAGMTQEQLQEQIVQQYRRDIEENTAYAMEIYGMVSQRCDYGLDWSVNKPFHFVSGIQAIILGASKAGLDFFYGYPMTPASSLLHYAALKQESLNLFAIHAESELAAINMALGSAMAGCRTAVGSSGGGFALMQEGFSAAGMVEAPLLCILSSRPGPATGASTYTAQEDLFFALHQGHGEFGRVVASPDSNNRALSLSAELLALAWELQIPTILLTEKHLSEGMADIGMNHPELPEAKELPGTAGASYQRYAATPNGVSPLVFPGHKCAPDTVVKWTTLEHLENGVRSDSAADIKAMKDKRGIKAKAIQEACKRYQTTAEYGEGELLVFAYGSTVLELREAQKYSQRPFKIIAPIYLEPFPHEKLEQYRGKEVVVVEHSQSGLFAQFLKIKLDVQVKHLINKYDGRAFDPIELAKQIEELQDA
ncbi:MAG: 2-oxoacid:acceptor oxidoreductase subunit alpha [Candidatus Cloacimonetes bacterium]|nr:2-oxoacid:acceptor oxidoreductase subunit alpha [Candidatus Cloacimonadota bacterium]